MVEEFFYGFSLNGDKPEHQWKGHKKPDPEDDESHISSKLILKRAVLGPEAAANELNVIEVETMSMQDMVKIPIAILKVGEERQLNLADIEFFDAPVTFRLVKGKGPVHVLGTHLQQDESAEEIDDRDVLDMDEFEDDEDDSEGNEEGNPKKKVKLSQNHNKKSKNDKNNT